MGVLSCKKEKANDNPSTEPVQTGSETIVAFRISILEVESKPKFYKPEVVIQAQGFESQAVPLTITTFSTNNPPPCNDYYFKAAKIYNLKFKANSVDTIILRNYKINGELAFQVKFLYDMTQSPAVLTRSTIGQGISPGIGTACPEQGSNAISFGGY